MSEANAKLQAVIDRLMANRADVCLLEAGCGSVSHLKLNNAWRMVGIDIAEHQLARNAMLQEKILGDVQTYVWPKDSFDMIVSWDVLEHLSEPRKALERFSDALRPGGIMVFALPNLYSLKGLITKFTPYVVHEWFYRYIIGDKRDKSQFDQFPTFLKTDVAPGRLKQFAEIRKFDVVYCDIYEGPVQVYLRRHNKLADIGFALLGGISRILSLGKLDLNLTDYIMVLQKTSAPV